MNNTKKYNIADFIGIAASSVCLVHCIATPLLIALGTAFFTHSAVTYLFLIVSFTSVFKATEHTTSGRIAMFLWISFWGFLFSVLFEKDYHWLHYITYLFSTLIITGHILNIRHCKSCKKNQ